MKNINHKAFTVIELIFVIVIIGILSAIAIPKFSETAKIAYASRAESVVVTLRSALATERQRRILRGDTSSDINTTRAEELLAYGLDSSWTKTDSNTLTYVVPGGTASCAFDIEGGKLVKKTCDAATGLDDL